MQMTALSHERPFPGLRPFGFADHPFFFGRDDQVYAIYRLLDRSRFIAVVGTSGGGKSSLVRAGLLPLLHQETMESGGRNWRFFDLRPGDSPISSLTDALAGPPPVGGDENKSAIHAARRERIAYAFRHSSFGLVEAIADLNDVEGCSILLLVDQFEELFRFSSIDRTANRDPAEEARRREEAAQFVQLLLEASRSQEPKIHVLITMRSDFIGDCARFHGLPEAVSATQFLVPSLTRDQREEVIRKPIEKAEATIDGALVERLLNDSNDEFDLPVLQHCLMRLWEKAGLAASPTDIAAAPAASETSAPAAPTPRHLRLEHYDEVGRIARALSLHADAIMASLPGREVAVEQTFRALSDVDKDGRATRRALSFRRLLEETGVPEDGLRQVVDRFRGEDCSFLVPPPSAEATLTATTRVDVGHESLLRRWEQICSAPTAELGARQAQHTGWLAAEEMDGRTYRAVLALIDSAPPGSRVTLPLDQVEARTKWWNARKRTEAWAERYGGGLDRVEQLFKDSRDALEAQRHKEQTAREAQRESEIKAAKLDAERQKAEAEAALQRTRSRSIRWVAALAFALAAVTLGTAIGAWLRYREAEVKRIESLSIQTRFLASQSEQETTRGNTRTGILLALAALDRQKDLGRDIADPEMALYGALGDHIGERIIGKYDRGQPIEFNLAGQRLLTLSDDKNVVILDPSGKPLVTLAHESSVSEAWFNEDGTRVASVSGDGNARIWDAAAGTLSATLPHPTPVTHIAFSRDGSRVVTIADDNTARVWPVSGGDPVELRHEASLTSAGINSDGRLVVTLEANKTVRVWDVATRTAEILQHPDNVTFAAFSPDGTRVLTICRDRYVREWNAKDRTPMYNWPHDSAVKSAVFSPNGKNVATVADDQTVRVWDATAEPPRQTSLAVPPPASATAALRHEGNLTLVRFNKSGSKLITIAEDNVVRLWSARGRKLAALQHKESVDDISFNPDETEILTASDGQLRSWNLNNALERRLIGADDVDAVTMNADGTRILGVSGSRGVHVWDENGKEVSAGVRGTPTERRLFERRSLILTRYWGDHLRLSDVTGKRIFETAGSLSAVSGDAARILVQNNKERTLTFWSVRGEKVRVIPHDKEARRLVASRDGSRAATVAGDGTVEIWSETGERIIELRPDDGNEPAHPASRPPARQASGKVESTRSLPARSVEFDAALTRILVLNYEDGVASLWDDRHNKVWSRPLDAAMRFVAFSPDGASFLFRAGSTAQLRNVADERVVNLQHEGEVAAAQFSPDGSRIVTISADKDHMRLWDGRGDAVAVLRHDRGVRSASFSASGEQVVTVDAENTVRVWESGGRQMAEIPHDGRVSVSVDAAGKRLVTVAPGNEPRIFNLHYKLDDLLGLAAGLKLAPLTEDERKRYFVD